MISYFNLNSILIFIVEKSGEISSLIGMLKRKICIILDPIWIASESRNLDFPYFLQQEIKKQGFKPELLRPPFYHSVYQNFIQIYA